MISINSSNTKGQRSKKEQRGYKTEKNALTRFDGCDIILQWYFEVWLSLVERCVRDAEVASSNLVTSTIMWRQKRCLTRKARIYRAFLLPKRRFFSVPKHRCKIAVFPLWIDLNSRKVNIRYARQIEIKNLSAFFITLKRRNQICCRKN